MYAFHTISFGRKIAVISSSSSTLFVRSTVSTFFDGRFGARENEREEALWMHEMNVCISEMKLSILNIFPSSETRIFRNNVSEKKNPNDYFKCFNIFAEMMKFLATIHCRRCDHEQMNWNWVSLHQNLWQIGKKETFFGRQSTSIN